MGSWGATTADEAKPKYLTALEKEGAYATDRGWTVAAGGQGRAGADREVLVAIRGLGTEATKLAEASISSFRFITTTTAATHAAGANLDINCSFNERVTVTGVPFVLVNNNNPGAESLEVDYLSGTGTNNLVFRKVMLTLDEAWNVDDELSIGADAIALNSGTIKDTVSTNNAVIDNTEAIGTAAGTITVSA
jgi:hypothetical protein